MTENDSDDIGWHNQLADSAQIIKNQLADSAQIISPPSININIQWKCGTVREKPYERSQPRWNCSGQLFHLWASMGNENSLISYNIPVELLSAAGTLGISLIERFWHFVLGDKPSGREGHISIIYKSHLIVFGGIFIFAKILFVLIINPFFVAHFKRCPEGLPIW